jgi:hypothetical protein
MHLMSAELLATACLSTQHCPCSGRVNYKIKVFEWTFELFWPLAVVGVGIFASVSALIYV